MARHLAPSGARWMPAAALLALLPLVSCGSDPAPAPEATPVATTLAPLPPPDTTLPMPPPMAAPAFPPPAAAEASPEPAPSAAPSEEPSPAVDEAAMKNEERLRAELAAAKAKAESLSTAAATECPDLKEGELRHPGAVGRCNRLKNEAAQAVAQYEALKKQAQAAGVSVQ